ncbi:MAG: right-handed parallel beta-helix repeat-containing protein [Bacillus sp. (in: firmicutes)]
MDIVSEKLVVPYEGMIITEDTTFAPGVYEFPSGKGITIGKSGITINGNGAVIVAPGKKEKKYSFRGTGIYSNGHSDLSIKNLTIKGFLLGCKLMNGTNILVENNDLSDNFTDPDYGWGDGDPDGALFLENVTRSKIHNNKGNNVWNGLHLYHCDENEISDNEFSYCTNVCLKMWRSSRNEITNNTMNYGIRIAPGEVHARDSTSVLIETGSNDNKFLHNDFTYGGDGVFIRSLNGVISTGNYFEGNDASYAHNNAWEVWDTGNIFINNKGNHSSYGFWLGGSDHTVFIGNEAAYNGKRRSNAPEEFGNAGVAVVNGSSSHFIMKDNYIHDNKSAGVAIRFKKGYESYHWIIQGNRILDNETYGIYLKHANWIDIAGNEFSGNKLGDIKKDENVTNYMERRASITDQAPTNAATISSEKIFINEPVSFDASNSRDPQNLSLQYRWEMGDGTIYECASFQHTYTKPGFYRVGLTVHNEKLADLTWFDIYAVEKGEIVGTEFSQEWGVKHSSETRFTRISPDSSNKVSGETSLRIVSNDELGSIYFPKTKAASWNFQEKKCISFWLKYEHETRDGFVDSQMPIVRLATDYENYLEFLPEDFQPNWTKLPSEARNGWIYFSIPMKENEGWKVHSVGNPQVNKINFIEFNFHSKGGNYYIWLDGLMFT